MKFVPLVLVALSLAASGERSPASPSPIAEKTTEVERISEFRERNKNFFDQPSRAEVYQVVLRSKDPNKKGIPEEMLAAARGLASRKNITLDEFRDIARKHSDDIARRDEGGRLGWLESGKIDPSLQEAVFPPSAREEEYPMGIIGDPVPLPGERLSVLFVAKRSPSRREPLSEGDRERVKSVMEQLVPPTGTPTSGAGPEEGHSNSPSPAEGNQR